MKKIVVDKKLLHSLLTMATLIEARDPYTGGHTWRVSQYARLLSLSFGLNNDESYAVQIGGLVHDLGKISTPDNVLNKKGALNEIEYEMIKKHPVIGAEVIKEHPLNDLIFYAIAYHHERIDGKGYPGNRRMENIPLVALIVGIADAFDAMTSVRPYRNRMETTQALAILKENAGTQFDSKLTEYFINLVEANKFEHILSHSGEEKVLMSCPGCGPIIVLSSGNLKTNKTICPACKGIFEINKAGTGFEIEWTGKLTSSYVPEPDFDTVETAMSMAGKEIVIPVDWRVKG